MVKEISEIRGLLDTTPEILDCFLCRDIAIKPHGVQAQSVKPVDGELKITSSFFGNRSAESGSAKIDENTVSDIGSITKMYTSALILKLWDNELNAKESGIFPSGIQTKLSAFAKGLKDKFPQTKEFFDVIEKTDHYKKVTLQDLLDHTHGLGERNNQTVYNDMLADRDRQFSCSDMVERSVYNSEKHKYGVHQYSNLGAELCGVIIELVSGKTYDQALREEVLEPIGASETYTMDQQVALYADPESNVARGYSYYNKALSESYMGCSVEGEINNNTSCNTRAAGGLKASSMDTDKFIRKFLNPKAGESSLFKNEKVVEALLDRRVSLDTNGVEQNYHLCVAQYEDGFYGHNGNDISFESSLRYNPITQESLYYNAAGETLTHLVAFDSVQKSSKELSVITVIEEQNKLAKEGFDFDRLCSMVEKGMDSKEIAAEIQNDRQDSIRRADFLALDNLDPKLQSADEKSKEISVAGPVAETSWVERMSSRTSQGSHEL
jgi:CubicO group peptidase (beta-lactamase class C family)